MITCGALSPSRPGVLIIGRSDGKLEIWDFTEDSNKMSAPMDLQIQTHLTALEFQVLDIEKYKSEQIVAVGDGTGVVRLFNVPRNFRVSQPQEKENMRNFWKRQQNRLEFMKTRAEIRKKQKLEEELKKQQEEEEKKDQTDLKADVMYLSVIA